MTVRELEEMTIGLNPKFLDQLSYLGFEIINVLNDEKDENEI